MFNVDDSLQAVRAALEPITPDSTEAKIDTAAAVATAELRRVASAVASFANALDDGIGFFNSSTEFGRQLVNEFDQARRISTVMGLLDGLSIDEVLMAIDVALLRLQVQTGPHSISRPFLVKRQLGSLERIRDTASATLRDSAMPSDPEDEESVDLG